MKTFIHNMIFAAAGLLLFGACSNEDMPESETFAPAIRGEMENLADEVPQTRMGVIEHGVDFAADGEQFYWVDGDQIKVLFFKDGDLNSEPVTVIYTAEVPAGTRPGSCNFVPEAGAVVPDGNYTVYGLSPASVWTKDATGYNVRFDQFDNTIFYQPDHTSHFLGKNMFMKAKTTVTVAGGNADAMNLSFKHLSALLRIRMTNTSSWPTPLKFKFLEFSTADNSVMFPSQAHLVNLDDEGLTPVDDLRKPIAQINGGTFTDFGLEFIYKTHGYGVNVFIPIIPFSIPDLTTKMKFNCAIDDSDNTVHLVNFESEFGLSFDNELIFLRNGFEAGKSYYFDFLLTDLS